MLINLTPHAVTLRDEYGQDHVIPPTAPPARIEAVPGEGGVCLLPGVPVPVYLPDRPGRVTGLPDQGTGDQSSRYYIVSAVVGAALSGLRSDVLVLGTGPNDGAIRDGDGRIVAVTRLKTV